MPVAVSPIAVSPVAVSAVAVHVPASTSFSVAELAASALTAGTPFGPPAAVATHAPIAGAELRAVLAQASAAVPHGWPAAPAGASHSGGHAPVFLLHQLGRAIWAPGLVAE